MVGVLASLTLLFFNEQPCYQLGFIFVSPTFKPDCLRIQCRPVLGIFNRFNIDVQVRPDKGAPLGECVLVVLIRQGVRLYKFFSEPMQPLSTLPS